MNIYRSSQLKKASLWYLTQRVSLIRKSNNIFIAFQRSHFQVLEYGWYIVKSRKSKKDSQYDGGKNKKKKEKCQSDLQNTTHKTKYWAILSTQNKNWGRTHVLWTNE